LNLDKLINNNNLFERLDRLYPDTISKDKNDGVNYWKGKKIVSLSEWRKIANSNKAFQKGIEYQNTREALQYFPNEYTDWLFPLGVQEELKEAAKKWYLDYLELMQYRKDPAYGKTKCFKCLLSTDREEAAIFLGINKVVARALDDNSNNYYSVYPCPIQNRFKCPYDSNKEGQEESKSIDVGQLFQLSRIAFLVELAFGAAQEKGETSMVPIRNVEDVYNALTDREMLNAILQQGLDEEHQKHKDKIVELFMSIKDKVRIQDLRFCG
jgi:hypothetical protein